MEHNGHRQPQTQQQQHHQPPAIAQSPSNRNAGPYPASISSHGSGPTSVHPAGTNYSSSDAYQPANSSASPSTIHSAQSLPNGLGPPFAYGHAPTPGPPAHGMMSEQYMNTDPALATPPRMSASHHPVSSLSSQQKRAYRQRRKDPSCDACRERKVKCDATDTSSCSECSSRGVKCQFTKETNRRMSSIKQVQDLEKQLALAKQQINQLRTMLREGGAATDSAVSVANVPSLHLPEPNSKEHRSAPPVLDGFDEARNNIRRYARGIFKPPPPYRALGPQPLYPHVTHALPPRSVADRLISNYRGSVHLYAPHLHWPTFIREYNDLYRVGTFQHSRHIWVALFYAVLACGALMEPNQRSSRTEETEGAQFSDKCIKSIDTTNDDLTVDHVRISLLLSIYNLELNMRSPGWVWLGSAVRIAYDIGLHIDKSGHCTPFEAEMRRRVWWSVYNWDRLVSMELGQPLMIDDDDCNVGEPTPIDDEHIRPNGIIAPPPGQSFPNGLIAVLPVVRIIAQLRKTLKSQTIAATTLAACDEHFTSIMMSWPEPFTMHSEAPLDPRLLTAGCSLQCMRFFLYRHNMSPACRPSDRRDALERCVSVAQDTAHYVQRTLQHPSTSPRDGYYASDHMAQWSMQIRSMAPAFFCNHLWRCQLVLCLRCDFTSALTLAHVSLAIGDKRRNNIACGRFLAFFLDQLISRLRAGATPQTLETNEEMLAYASGDMQGNAEDAWAWTGSDAGATLHQAPLATDGPPWEQSGLHPDLWSAGMLSEREATEWGGWEHIQRVLSQLIADQTGASVPLPTSHAPHTPGNHSGTAATSHGHATPHLAPRPPPASQPSVSPAPSNGQPGASFGSSRISIKDIM